MRRKVNSEMTWRAFERQRGYIYTYDGPKGSKYGNKSNSNITAKVETESCCHINHQAPHSVSHNTAATSVDVLQLSDRMSDVYNDLSCQSQTLAPNKRDGISCVANLAGQKPSPRPSNVSAPIAGHICDPAVAQEDIVHPDAIA